MAKTFEQLNQKYINAVWPYYESMDEPKMRAAEKEWLERINFYKYQTSDTNYDNKLVPGVYIWRWGRDCDGVEAAGVQFIEARAYEDYEKEYCHCLDWADGPERWTIISKLEADQQKDAHYWIDHCAAAAGY